MNHFAHFRRASGSEVNFDKTKALALGSWRIPTIALNDRYQVEYVKTMKIFGLFFNKIFSECGVQNWEDALKYITETIPRFYVRSDSISGKAILINTLIQAKFLYPLQTFDPSQKVFKIYKKQVRKFVLAGGMCGINHSTLVFSYIRSDKGKIPISSPSAPLITLNFLPVFLGLSPYALSMVAQYLRTATSKGVDEMK